MGQERDVYQTMSAAKNILQTSLQNGNPVIHPTITLMNVALIERTKGDFDFYHEGVTPAVGRLIEAVDRERIAIGKKLGVDVIPDPELGVMQGYMTEATYDNGFITAPGFEGVTPAVGRLIEAVDKERITIGKKLGVDVIPDPELGVIQGYMTEATYDNGFITSPGFEGVKAQSSLDYRYFNEDVGYGLVFLQKLGEQVGVATPIMSAVITLVSLLMNRNYLGEAKRTMETLGLSKHTANELEELLA